MSGPGRRLSFLLVLLVALTVRLVNAGWMSGHPFSEFQTEWPNSDMTTHWLWSGRIRDGDVLCRDTFHPYAAWMERIAPMETWERWRGSRQVFNKAPLYPYALAAMRRIGGDGFWGFATGQLVMGLVSVALVFALADHLFGLAVARVAGLGATLYGPFLLYETVLLRDSLAVTVSLLLLWGLARCTSAAPGRWLVAGVLFSIALLARELTLLFLPFVVLWVVQRWWGRWKALATALASFAGGAVLGLLPLVARNLAVGVPALALSAIGTEGIVYGHAAGSAPAGFVIPPAAKSILSAADGRLLDTVRLTIGSYNGDWGALLRGEAARFAAIFASYEPTDNVSWYYFVDRWPLLRFSLRWEVVLALGLVGIWLARGRTRNDDWPLLYFLLASLAGLQALPVIGRYRLVPAAVLLVYAAGTVVWLTDAVRNRYWRTVAAAGLSVAAIFVLSLELVPTGAARYRYRRTEFMVAAEGYVAERQPERAYEELKAGLRTAYAGPEQRRLPSGYLDMVTMLVRVGRTIGRDADATATVARLKNRYADDRDLEKLLNALDRRPLRNPG